ncbi:MAG: Fic family protein, partial [Bdellovibrionota bacterium]
MMIRNRRRLLLAITAFTGILGLCIEAGAAPKVSKNYCDPEDIGDIAARRKLASQKTALKERGILYTPNSPEALTKADKNLDRMAEEYTSKLSGAKGEPEEVTRFRSVQSEAKLDKAGEKVSAEVAHGEPKVASEAARIEEPKVEVVGHANPDNYEPNIIRGHEKDFERTEQGKSIHSIGLDLVDGTVVEGSVEKGLLQPDYVIDFKSHEFDRLRNYARDVGKLKTPTEEKIRLIKSYVHGEVLPRTDTEDPRYMALLKKYRNAGEEIPLSAYAACKGAVCRENAMTLHLALKEAGIENRFVYAKMERTLYAKGKKPDVYVYDHGFVVIPLNDHNWIADSYISGFHGLDFDQVSREDLTRGMKLDHIAGAKADPNVTRKVLRVLDYPIAWKPKTPQAAEAVIASSRRAPESLEKSAGVAYSDGTFRNRKSGANIGFFGDAFDPPRADQLEAVQKSIKEGKLDELLVFVDPNKGDSTLTSREKMAELALAGPKVKFIDPAAYPGKTYEQVFDQVAAKNKSHTISQIVNDEALADKNFGKIKNSNVRYIVAGNSKDTGMIEDALAAKFGQRLKKDPTLVTRVETAEGSAATARKALERGETAGLSPAVANYVQKENLYKDSAGAGRKLASEDSGEKVRYSLVNSSKRAVEEEKGLNEQIQTLIKEAFNTGETPRLAGTARLPTYDETAERMKEIRKLWADTKPSNELRASVDKIAKTGDVSKEFLASTKELRARLKVIRFFCEEMCTEKTQLKELDQLTKTFGHLTDAASFGPKAKDKVKEAAKELSELLGKSSLNQIDAEMKKMEPLKAKELAASLEDDFKTMRKSIYAKDVAEKDFHEVRKTIGRMQTILLTNAFTEGGTEQEKKAFQVFRKIYDQIGDEHDKMIAAEFEKGITNDRVAFTDTQRSQIERLIEHFEKNDRIEPGKLPKGTEKFAASDLRHSLVGAVPTEQEQSLSSLRGSYGSRFDAKGAAAYRGDLTRELSSAGVSRNLIQAAIEGAGTGKRSAKEAATFTEDVTRDMAGMKPELIEAAVAGGVGGPRSAKDAARFARNISEELAKAGLDRDTVAAAVRGSVGGKFTESQAVAFSRNLQADLKINGYERDLILASLRGGGNGELTAAKASQFTKTFSEQLKYTGVGHEISVAAVEGALGKHLLPEEATILTREVTNKLKAAGYDQETIVAAVRGSAGNYSSSDRVVKSTRELLGDSGAGERRLASVDSSQNLRHSLVAAAAPADDAELAAIKEEMKAGYDKYKAYMDKYQAEMAAQGTPVDAATLDMMKAQLEGLNAENPDSLAKFEEKKDGTLLSYMKQNHDSVTASISAYVHDQEVIGKQIDVKTMAALNDVLKSTDPANPAAVKAWKDAKTGMLGQMTSDADMKLQMQANYDSYQASLNKYFAANPQDQLNPATVQSYKKYLSSLDPNDPAAFANYKQNKLTQAASQVYSQLEAQKFAEAKMLIPHVDYGELLSMAKSKGLVDAKDAGSLAKDPVFDGMEKLSREERKKVYGGALQVLKDVQIVADDPISKRNALRNVVAAERFGLKDPKWIGTALTNWRTDQRDFSRVMTLAREHLQDADIAKIASIDDRRQAAVRKAIDSVAVITEPENRNYYNGIHDLDNDHRNRLAKMLVACTTGIGSTPREIEQGCREAAMHVNGANYALHSDVAGIDVVASKSVEDAQQRFARLNVKLDRGGLVDDDLDIMRFVNLKDFSKASDSLHGEEIYGVDNFVAWKDAKEYLGSIPKGHFDPSVELFEKVHSLASQGLNPDLKAMSEFIPDGWVPSKGGVLKERDSIGKYALTHPLTEDQLAAIKANPYLNGFIEIPFVSHENAHYGWIYYAHHEETRARLEKLIAWYKANEKTMDPVELAARFQYDYVSIHPMIDGNGRTSRLLMDKILQDHGLPPAILKDSDQDILLPIDKQVTEVRKGVDRFLSIAETKGLNITPASRNDVNPALALSTAGGSALYDRIQTLATERTEFTSGGKIFNLSTNDGMIYDVRGIPYVAHDGGLYPVSDRTYRMLEMNVKRTNYTAELSPAHESYVKANADLVEAIRDGKQDASKLKLEPYSTIDAANRADDLYIYPWQKDALAHAIDIDATKPEDVLRPFRSPKTDFDGKAAQGAEFIKPYDVLAQYEMVDKVYYDLEQTARKSNYPDLVAKAVDSRRKIHEAARSILEPYFEAFNKLEPEQQMLVRQDRSVKLFNAYLERSKLVYKDFDVAMKKVDDKVMYVMRSDSSAVNYTGFLSHADFVKLVDKLPMSQKLRATITNLHEYMDSAVGGAAIKKWIAGEKAKADGKTGFLPYLPKSLKSEIDELNVYYPRLQQAVDYTASTLFGSKYANHAAGPEFERAFVTEALHAGGGAFKEEKSYTTSTKLMEEFTFSGTAADAGSIVHPQISLVKIPKEHAKIDFGSDSFKNEYEILGNHYVGPQDIVQKFAPKDLAGPWDGGTATPQVVKDFVAQKFDRAIGPDSAIFKDPRADLAEAAAAMSKANGAPAENVRHSLVGTIRPAPNENLEGAVVMSTSSLEKDPKLAAALSPLGALGQGGVLGWDSPANKFGPSGSFGPSWLISGRDWSKEANSLKDGPLLSHNGVFGANGPVGKAYNNAAFKAYQEGGPLMVLGPKGPLGPYGSLGPLGEVGAHGFKADPKTGAFLKDGKVISATQVLEQQGMVSRDLVEHYQPTYARNLSDHGELGGSFKLDDSVAPGQSKSLTVNVKKDTWHTWMASGDDPLRPVSIRVLSPEGKVIAEADSRSLVNFVSLRVPQDGAVKVEVKSLSNFPFDTFNPFNRGYTLHSVEAPVDASIQDFRAPYLTTLSNKAEELGNSKAAKVASSDEVRHSLVTRVDSADVRLTQYAVGQDEVEKTLTKMGKKSNSFVDLRSAVLKTAETPLPAVVGPDLWGRTEMQTYITDGHHKGDALYRLLHDDYEDLPASVRKVMTREQQRSLAHDPIFQLSTNIEKTYFSLGDMAKDFAKTNRGLLPDTVEKSPVFAPVLAKARAGADLTDAETKTLVNAYRHLSPDFARVKNDPVRAALGVAFKDLGLNGKPMKDYAQFLLARGDSAEAIKKLGINPENALSDDVQKALKKLLLDDPEMVKTLRGLSRDGVDAKGVAFSKINNDQIDAALAQRAAKKEAKAAKKSDKEKVVAAADAPEDLRHSLAGNLAGVDYSKSQYAQRLSEYGVDQKVVQQDAFNSLFNKEQWFRNKQAVFSAIDSDKANGDFKTLAEAANLGDSSRVKKAVLVESAVTKDLNDQVVKDKDLVTALMNTHKDVLWTAIQRDPVLSKHLVGQYTDFKAMKFAFDSADPALDRRLKEVFSDVNARYAEFVKSEAKKQGWDQNAVGLAGDIANWHHMGIGATPDEANWAARQSRTMLDEKGLARPRLFSEVKDRVVKDLAEIKDMREDLEKRFGTVPRMFVAADDGKKVLSAEAVEAIRKAKPLTEGEDALNAAVKKSLDSRFARDFDAKDVAAFRAYAAKVDSFSPDLYLDKRVVIPLAGRRNGIVSADFKGQNARNIEETMKAMARTEGQSTTQQMQAIRQGEQIATAALEQKKAQFFAAVSKIDPNAHEFVFFSGDDGIYLPAARLTDAQKQQLARDTAESDLRLTYSPSHYADTGGTIPEQRLSGYIGEAEKVEKDLRAAMIHHFPAADLNRTQIAVDMTPHFTGEKRVGIYIGGEATTVQKKKMQDWVQNYFETHKHQVDFVETLDPARPMLAKRPPELDLGSPVPAVTAVVNGEKVYNRQAMVQMEHRQPALASAVRYQDAGAQTLADARRHYFSGTGSFRDLEQAQALYGKFGTPVTGTTEAARRVGYLAQEQDYLAREISRATINRDYAIAERLKAEQAGVSAEMLAAEQKRAVELAGDAGSVRRGAVESLKKNFPRYAADFPGRTFEQVAADPQEAKLLAQLNARDAAIARAAAADARAQLEDAVKQKLTSPGLLTTEARRNAAAKALAQDIVDLRAAGGAPSDLVKRNPSRWNESLVKTCQDSGICGPKFQARKAEFAQANLSPTAQRILAEERIANADAKAAAEAQSV